MARRLLWAYQKHSRRLELVGKHIQISHSAGLAQRLKLRAVSWPLLVRYSAMSMVRRLCVQVGGICRIIYCLLTIPYVFSLVLEFPLAPDWLSSWLKLSMALPADFLLPSALLIRDACCENSLLSIGASAGTNLRKEP